MEQLTAQEHTTALFVVAMYHWFIDDEINASYVLEVALRIAKNPLATGNA